MKRWLSLAVVFLAACLPMWGTHPVELSASAPGTTTFHTLRVGPRERSYILHRPPTARGGLPLLVVLHGNHANATTVRDEARLERAADSLGVVLAYLNGSGALRTANLTWNDGACCAWARKHRIDDGAAVRALVDTLSRLLATDRRRAYLVGLSAGGTLALHLVCEGDTTFAAVASIAGTMPVPACHPRKPLRVLLMRGDRDAELPKDHDENRTLGAPPYAWSFPASRAYWAAFDGCGATTVVDRTADVTVTRAADCPNGLVATEVVVHGQPHGWPGGAKPWLFAPTPAHYDAAPLLFAFFLSTPAR